MRMARNTAAPALGADENNKPAKPKQPGSPSVSQEPMYMTYCMEGVESA